MAAVFTHPFEHGHPDHDAAALAVALACRRLGASAPRHFEFASYHLGAAGRVFGSFRPGSGPAGIEIALTPAERARKRQALACFKTQAAIIAWFPLASEPLRPAPDYDFLQAPGPALYEHFHAMPTAAAWRAQAAEMLKRL
jgi:LmbE family N-acetylglucosaminyl deacetylase